MHTTKFEAPGWTHAVIIHNQDWSGTIEISGTRGPAVSIFHVKDGHFVPHAIADVDELSLIFAAGQVIGRDKFCSKIGDLMEQDE